MTRGYYSDFVGSFKSCEAKYHSPYLDVQIAFSASKIPCDGLTYCEFLSYFSTQR